MKKCMATGGRVAAGLVLLLGFASRITCLDNGLGMTPQMGYNSWNVYHEDIDEEKMKEAAELMVTTGLVDAGYTYFIIDDGWAEVQRTPGKPIRYNSTKFPNGLKGMADYVKSKGMKLGVYTSAGSKSCIGLSATGGHEEEDAKQLAEWGVEYIKYDNCWAIAEGPALVERYKIMRDALNKTGKPIFFSMCEWGSSSPWRYAQEIANSWRTTKDITLALEGTWPGITLNLDNAIGLAQYGGPGGWNDADMLLVGLPGSGKLSLGEQRAHFALWAIMKSPLIVGADLRTFRDDEISLLSNKEIIAIHQDPLGVPGDIVWKEGAEEIWAAPLQNGARIVALFNRHLREGDTAYESINMTIRWRRLGIPEDAQATVRDLHLHQDAGIFTKEVTAVVYTHDVRMLLITPVIANESYNLWRPWNCKIIDDKNTDDDNYLCSSVADQPSLTLVGSILNAHKNASAWAAKNVGEVLATGMAGGFFICLFLVIVWTAVSRYRSSKPTSTRAWDDTRD